MYGSRSRFVGGHPEWSPTDPYGRPGWTQYGADAASAGYLGVGAAAPYPHAPFPHHPPADRTASNMQELVESTALRILFKTETSTLVCMWE